MLRFFADENLNNDIGADDATILEWPAEQSRVVLTHDVSTMTRYAYERVEAGLPMPGVFEVSRKLALGQVIEDLLLLAECSHDHEWDSQVQFVGR